MTDDTTQRDIGRIEGRLEGVEGKLDDIARLLQEQNAQASESRKALYERVGRVETAIEVSGQIEAQVRNRLDGLEKRLEDDIKPTIDEVKRWKITGMTVLSMVGIAGASIGAFVMWGWEVIVSKWNGGP